MKKKYVSCQLTLFLLVGLAGCVPERPQVRSSNASLKFDHSGITSNCSSCHEKDRPAAVAGKIHGDGQDCSLCHSPDSWQVVVNFSHTPTPQACNSCHNDQRPANSRWLERDPNLPSSHFAGLDCVECHLTADTPGNGPWRFVHTDASDNNIQFCLPCHYDKGMNEHGNQDAWFQPDIYDYQNGQLGNCYNCHKKRKSFDD